MLPLFVEKYAQDDMQNMPLLDTKGTIDELKVIKFKVQGGEYVSFRLAYLQDSGILNLEDNDIKIKNRKGMNAEWGFTRQCGWIKAKVSHPSESLHIELVKVYCSDPASEHSNQVEGAYKTYLVMQRNQAAAAAPATVSPSKAKSPQGGDGDAQGPPDD